MKKLLFLLGVSLCLCSCVKEETIDYSIAGSVWIHVSGDEDGFDDATSALCFGDDEVDYYLLDDRMKVVHHINTFKYRLKGNHVIIGVASHRMYDGSIYFQNRHYYRTDHDADDLF